MQGDVSGCDRTVKIDIELQGKEYVLEMEMHTELKKLNSSMNNNEMCNLRPNQL